MLRRPSSRCPPAAWLDGTITGRRLPARLPACHGLPAVGCLPACHGLPASLPLPAGLVNLWIQDIRDTRDKSIEVLRKLRGPEQVDKLVELNVMRQVRASNPKTLHPNTLNLPVGTPRRRPCGACAAGPPPTPPVSRPTTRRQAVARRRSTPAGLAAAACPEPCCCLASCALAAAHAQHVGPAAWRRAALPPSLRQPTPPHPSHRAQVFNVCTSPIVQQAWDAGQTLAVHGLVYALSDGILKVGRPRGADARPGLFSIAPAPHARPLPFPRPWAGARRQRGVCAH